MNPIDLQWADVVRAAWPDATDADVEFVVALARDRAIRDTDGRCYAPHPFTIRVIAQSVRRHRLVTGHK